MQKNSINNNNVKSYFSTLVIVFLFILISGVGYITNIYSQPTSLINNGLFKWIRVYSNATLGDVIISTIAITNNSETTPSVGETTDGYFWNSNQVLYWVTSEKTNLISDGR